MRDLHSKLAPKRAISPVSISDNTPLVSQIIDRQGFNSLEFIILLGALADADATFAVLVEDGDQANLSDAVAVPAKYLLGTIAQVGFKFDDDDKVRKIGYIGTKRYIRITITPTNNIGAALIAATAILGHPANAPTPNPPV